jgi:hypothetical protein
MTISDDASSITTAYRSILKTSGEFSKHDVEKYHMWNKFFFVSSNLRVSVGFAVGKIALRNILVQVLCALCFVPITIPLFLHSVFVMQHICCQSTMNFLCHNNIFYLGLCVPRYHSFIKIS